MLKFKRCYTFQGQLSVCNALWKKSAPCVWKVGNQRQNMKKKKFYIVIVHLCCYQLHHGHLTSNILVYRNPSVLQFSEVEWDLNINAFEHLWRFQTWQVNVLLFSVISVRHQVQAITQEDLPKTLGESSSEVSQHVCSDRIKGFRMTSWGA